VIARAQAILRRAYQATEMKVAQRLLLDLARRLEAEYPSAADSVREGLDETLTNPPTVATPTPLAGHHERGRKPDQPHAPGEAQRQAVARRTDDAAMGRGRGPRSRQRLPSLAGIWLTCPRWSTRCVGRDRQLGLVTAEEDRQVAWSSPEPPSNFNSGRTSPLRRVRAIRTPSSYPRLRVHPRHPRDPRLRGLSALIRVIRAFVGLSASIRAIRVMRAFAGYPR
jgi:hypothetical protein